MTRSDKTQIRVQNRVGWLRLSPRLQAVFRGSAGGWAGRGQGDDCLLSRLAPGSSRTPPFLPACHPLSPPQSLSGHFFFCFVFFTIKKLRERQIQGESSLTKSGGGISCDTLPPRRTSAAPLPAAAKATVAGGTRAQVSPVLLLFKSLSPSFNHDHLLSDWKR